MTPVRTIFFGSGAFGIEALRALDRLMVSDLIDLVAVVTAPPRPAGRTGALRSTAIDDMAQELAVNTILRPSRLRAVEAIAEVLALQSELAILADYGQIIPAPILGLRRGALNLHPSLLPRHRGATPIPAAILAGDAETGVTLFRMDEGLDTGPIVAQERHHLDGSETTPALQERLGEVAADVLRAALPDWLVGRIEPVPQDDRAATLTRPLRREDGRLDPSRDAIILERQVRAYQPWPGSWFETPVGRVIVWRAAVTDVDRPPSAGSIGVLDVAGVATSRGFLDLLEVQPAGGRRMSWEAFVRGRPQVIGTQLPP